ncbi:MAG: hypothetical protein Q4E74_11855 [Ruminococcus sp.]|nr:hypothetical protein [Ruminococcus sp.]
MLYTIVPLEDVLRTDLYSGEALQCEDKADFFSTNPADYISQDGIYF